MSGTDELMGHIYYYAFWGIGIFSCFAIVGLAYVVTRAILQARDTK